MLLTMRCISAAQQPPRHRAGEEEPRQQRDPNQDRSHQREQKNGGQQAEDEKDQDEADRSKRADIDPVPRAGGDIDAAMRPPRGLRSFGRKDFRLYRRTPWPVDIVAHLAITKVVVPGICQFIPVLASTFAAARRSHDGVLSAC